ncbi:MAG: lysine-sensitive aspartokinase 3 [Bdellovibrio sp.]|nr:lysine-sensitive aspartokinase 3 [Bdellovibrio sp.]
MSLENLSVAKFGGTSMGSAAAMRKSAALVASKPEIGLVVVSATSGTTNELLRIFNGFWESQAHPDLESLQKKHRDIARDLGISGSGLSSIEELFEELRRFPEENRALSRNAALDLFLSYGERISSHLFVTALKNEGLAGEFFDVRQVLVTDDFFGKAEPQLAALAKRTEEILLPKLERQRDPKIQVTQGFIGATVDGRTTTLGRGGSDFSAALLAEGLGASELQIWTDVPGIMTMDPNVVSRARIIPALSFSEAAELANFGAKVLHPETIWPAARREIRTFVGSTFQPELGGTWIYPDAESVGSKSVGSEAVKAIAVRKKQTLMTVNSLRMLNAHGFLAKLFGVLANHKISVDLVTTSEVSVALTFDQNTLGSSGGSISSHAALLGELKEFGEVHLEEGLSLVAIVGTGITRTSQLNARTFNAIAQFNIRMVCQGASPHNLCFLVNSDEAVEVVNRLHREFIETQERHS